MLNEQNEKEYLNSFPMPSEMLRIHNDCSYATIIVYSYMLCRYARLKSEGKEFSESTTEIADNCHSKDATVRLAIRWLKKEGYLETIKREGVLHNSNAYIVHDKFDLYDENGNQSESSLMEMFDQPDQQCYDVPHRQKDVKFDDRYIYLVSSGEHQKIGIAANVKSRLSNLQTSVPFELKLIATYKPLNIPANKIEKNLHELYKDFSVRGEWFKMQLSGDEFNKMCQSLDVACN